MQETRHRGRARVTAGAAGLALALAAVGIVGAGVAPAAAQAAPDQVVNGSFDDGLAGWTNYPSPSLVDGQACIDVPAGSGPYSAAISQQSIPVIAGESYELTFTASATPATGVVRAVIQGGPEVNYAQAMPEQQLQLTPEPQTFTFVFTDNVELPLGGELAIQQNLANDTAYRLCVDDVSLIGGVEPPAYEPDTGPRVRVNQMGYLPDGPKGATLVTEATEPVPWELRDGGGQVVATGTTEPQGVDPSAGLNVATIDFGDVSAPGDGYTLVADGETSHPFDISADLYDRLRTDAKTFYYTNRSGIEISDALAPGYGRPAGHVGVPPNQGDTAVPCQDLDDDSQQLYDEPWTCEGTRDVSGGWYDAGDHGKYVVNAGISVSQLMAELERTKTAPTSDGAALADGTLAIPEAGNGVPDILDEARWELEWMLRMQVPDGEQYAGMANHKVADVDWTGIPLLPSDDPQRRVLYRPSTAATLNLAAAAAQGARLFASYDPAFAGELLAAAERSYAAAEAEPGLYAPAPDPALDPNPGSGPYDDDDVSDEFYWAAAELYLTTGQRAYEADVLASPHHDGDVFAPGGFDWGDVAALGRLDLATVPNDLPGRRTVRKSVLAAADAYLADQAAQPFGQAYAPEDGDYVWGSNSQILNNMVVLGTAYDISGDPAYLDGVVRSVDYVLGRNALNISYVTGWGDVAAENQHSRWYAAAVDPSLPHPPAGTVAGGPNSTAVATGDPVAIANLQGCVAQFCYIDDIGSWSTNEITINWNAPLSWVASFLADQGSGAAIEAPECTVTYDRHGWRRGGFGAQVRVRNTGDETVSGWTLEWAFVAGQTVERATRATTEQEGATVTAGNHRSNATIRPGRSVSFGIFGDSPAGFANPAPELFRLNGEPCVTAGR
jgi:endoglucanase